MTPALLVPLLLAAAPTPREVAVPPALLEVTSPPELSGIAWSAALDRYLVVSDDTGVRGRGGRHAPMVLALDASGRGLDPAPIPIAGIDALKDAEAICAGPDGTFFLLTSHSPSNEGKTGRARRQLLHLALRGRGLAALGALDLTAPGGASALLAVAGLDPGGQLDLEAVAYHAGALYVGLKSPLAADGRAVILRLADPMGAARAGRVPPGALTRFAAVPLCVEQAGRRVCEGFSDLLFLQDGSLVAAANAPKGGPSDGGGAVWWLPAPPAGASPRVLARFPGLKPEGIALAPDGRRLAVVFDRGAEQPPLFTELELPGPPPPR